MWSQYRRRSAPHSNGGRVRLLGLIVLGAALRVVGVYVGKTDDVFGDVRPMRGDTS